MHMEELPYTDLDDRKRLYMCRMCSLICFAYSLTTCHGPGCSLRSNMFSISLCENTHYRVKSSTRYYQTLHECYEEYKTSDRKYNTIQFLEFIPTGINWNVPCDNACTGQLPLATLIHPTISDYRLVRWGCILDSSGSNYASYKHMCIPIFAVSFSLHPTRAQTVTHDTSHG